MGHEGIPLLNGWNRRALALFCELFTGFFKEFGYVGAEEYAAREIPAESAVEARALRSAWAQIYRFFTEYELKKSELERTQQRGR